MLLLLINNVCVSFKEQMTNYVCMRICTHVHSMEVMNLDFYVFDFSFLVYVFHFLLWKLSSVCVSFFLLWCMCFIF
jgi:hypothetical protein